MMSPELTWSYIHELTWCHLSSHDLTLHELTWCHLSSHDLTLHELTWCHLSSHDVTCATALEHVFALIHNLSCTVCLLLICLWYTHAWDKHSQLVGYVSCRSHQCEAHSGSPCVHFTRDSDPDHERKDDSWLACLLNMQAHILRSFSTVAQWKERLASI